VAYEPGLRRAAAHVALREVGQHATQLLHIVTRQLLLDGRQEPGAAGTQARKQWEGCAITCLVLCVSRAGWQQEA
jgi:hypothetical protein